MRRRLHMLLIAGLLAAACGGGGETSSSTTVSSAPSESATSAVATSVASESTSTDPPGAPTSTSAPATTVPGSDATSSNLSVRVPDHLRYGSDGLVLVVGGVETRVIDDPVEWASSDGAGGFVYSVDGQVWWQSAGNDNATAIEAEGLFARLVDGRPTLIARTDEQCSDDGEFFWLVLHDLASGEERRLACVGWGGDATVGAADFSGDRYVVEWGMDLANYSTKQGLIIGELGATDSGGPLWTGLAFPGNPYPDHETCRVLREGETTAACEVLGLLSPDGALLATWYRPDFSIVGDPMGMPPEVVADHAGWLARLDTLGAEVAVHELDTGVERYRTELAARTRIADFDGRFLVVAPRESGTYESRSSSNQLWTIVDTSGRQPPVAVPGPLVLLRPQGDGEVMIEVAALTIRRGDTGVWVSFLQQVLVARGPAIDVDGIFGSATEAAVRELQMSAGIEVEGIVGPVTWTMLLGEAPPTPSAILRPGGVGPVDFGTPAGEAVTELTGILGPPGVDELLEPLAPGEEDCVEGASWDHCLRANGVLEHGRIVRWPNRGLAVAFTDAVGSAGALTPTPLQFSSWRAVRPVGGNALTTDKGIGPGSTVGELRAVYPEHWWLFNEGVWDGVWFVCAGSRPSCFESAIRGELDYDPDGDSFTSAYVEAIQRALNAQGADLAVDGEIGPHTRSAWEQFCASRDLSCTAGPPDFPWFIIEEQRAALEFPPADVRIAALTS